MLVVQVYCIMEMEMPHCLLPWNSKLTTNSEAAAGWTDEQLHRMACDKLDFIKDACEEVRMLSFVWSSHSASEWSRVSDVHKV